MASTSANPAYPSPDQILAAARAVAQALGSEQCYAIVGGAACMLLGSTRLTTDVDLVVPKGETRKARQLLKNQKDFVIDSRTNHTIYLGASQTPVDIGILTPPALFREPFDKDTETIDVDGVQVLKPTLILDAKCRSVINRTGEGKKKSDAHDIRFLLKWCVDNDMLPTASGVPNATKELVEYFVTAYDGEELWSEAGYNISLGTWNTGVATESQA